MGNEEYTLEITMRILDGQDIVLIQQQVKLMGNSIPMIRSIMHTVPDAMAWEVTDMVLDSPRFHPVESDD